MNSHIVIDKGICKFGKNVLAGESTESHWESTLEGNTIMIGHEGEEFLISTKCFYNLNKFLLVKIYYNLKISHKMWENEVNKYLNLQK